MNRDVSTGLVTFSVDLEPSVDRPYGPAEDFDAVCRHLINLFDHHKVPATWGVADPARSVAREELRAFAGHEIAILGDRSWLSDEVGRAGQVRELTRRVFGARKAGINVSTLVLRNTDLADYTWLREFGLTAVRRPPVACLTHADTLGAWRVPASASWWERWTLGRKTARKISGGTLHIAVEAYTHAAEGRGSGLRLLDELLTLVTAKSRQGKLRIATVGRATADEIAPVAGPSRSALRAA